MRIHNLDEDSSLNQVGILLTLHEARELRDKLDALIDAPSPEHVHIDDVDYRKEISIALYDVANLSGFSPRVRKLIEEDV